MKMAERCYIYRGETSLVKLSYDANRKRYPASIFESFTKFRFSGMDLPVPGAYDQYLTLCYGNWRTPPPRDQRQSHAFDQSGENWNVDLPPDEDRLL